MPKVGHTAAATERDPTTVSAPALSLERLYVEHFDFVWRTLRRMGVQPAQLDDAAQDVFLVVHRRLPEYRPRWSPRSWLFAIARRVASDYRRTLRRKGGLSPLPDSLRAPGCESPDVAAARGEASRIVLEFLETLDEDRRAVFVLAELEQMTAREISSALNTNQSTIYSRLGSARKALLRYLQEHHTEEFGPDTEGLE